ncbi:MAG TPA: response regulator transcription factor [Polyangiaceae bacterium]|nr:response regulator transcription factor [Polyangiaceae bacterium]
MRVAIIGGESGNEAQLARIARRYGSCETYRPSSAGLESELGRAARALEAQVVPDRRGPLALVFEAGGEIDLAAAVLQGLRQDPDFEATGALLIAELADARSVQLPSLFDDFVLHAASAAELRIRLQALGRRRTALGALGMAPVAGIVIDHNNRSASVNGQVVKLTAREFALFSHFCRWRGEILSREHLLSRVWGGDYSGGRRTVDIHVRRLRAKLGDALPLETLRGRGYRLADRRSDTDSELPPSEARIEQYRDAAA